MLAAGANGATWDDDALDAFLTKPTDFIADTAMHFPGYSDPADRRKVIAYLKHRAKR